MLLGTLLATLALASPQPRIRGQVGAQLQTRPNGLLDFGYRKGPLSVELFTDTLDLRLTQQTPRGRATLGLRAAAAAAGLWISPWSQGAPDLDRAQRAAYVGVDAEAQRYLPGGAWVGASAFVRPHFFTPLPGSSLQIPDTLWAQARAQLGLWRNDGALRARLYAGVDATAPGRLSPHLGLAAALEPDRPLTPVLAAWAGAAWQADDIVATRLGGLTPYHVPFAGAAWAELWVEDYAVGRLGLRARTGPLTLQAWADAGAWTPPTLTTAPDALPGPAVGLGASARVRPDAGWFAELAAGYAPGLPRPAGIWPVPIFFRIGADWQPLRPS